MGLLAASASLPLLGPDATDAKRKKKKVKLCLNGQTITVPKKKRGSYISRGATPGACLGVCTPGGCSGGQVCDAGTCRTCDVTCNGDPIACGSALSQRLIDGGTISVCPGRYQGNFMMGNARLIGAGSGENPATSTILDAAGSGCVVTVSNNATAELIGLRITGGKVAGYGGGVYSGTGDLRITGCTIIGNEASSFAGGIYSVGPFRLTNSTVSQNRAGYGAGLVLQGAPPTFLTDSVISRNETPFHVNSFGGGVFNARSNLTVVGTEISQNSAGKSGGGISNSSGTITLNATTRVINNSALTTGGIHNDLGTVNLNGATVSDNSAPQCSNVPGC